MPLIYQHQINDSTKVGVWHIIEHESFFAEKVQLHQNINHPHKRLQHLAGRYLLTQLFLEFPLIDIKISTTKKPYLKDNTFHFSISHCGNYAAAIISTKNCVGVDVETPQQKITLIQHKFLSKQELLILKNYEANEVQKIIMAWSTKEAIFKWYGLGEVDFKKHIIIKNLQKEQEYCIIHCLFTKHTLTDLQVYNCTIANTNLAWVITP